jgi:prophage regulatory protein
MRATKSLVSPTTKQFSDHQEESSHRLDVPTRMLRARIVCERTGLSRSTLWRLERKGAGPRHRQLSANAVGWIEHEVDSWIQTRESR